MPMKLLTKEIIKKTPKLYSTENIKPDEKMITAKFFNPLGHEKWFLMELSEDNDIAYGLCVVFEKELGIFSINELKEIKLPFGLKIERDLYFQPCKYKDLKDIE
tara:strand:+ start:274 stop:585 length:312 start_codon:yes stop_codon:yes gene_type:complete